MTPDALAALHAACFVRPRPWSAAEFARLLAAPGVFACALPEDAARGFALGRVAADEAELLTLAVHPDARRRGLGRALLAAFEAEAAARGARRAVLEVAADNAPGCALYRGAGWAEAGRRPGYFAAAGAGGPGTDAILMAKVLATPAAAPAAARGGPAGR